jgi:predicted component of type VI protein secretion system
LVADFVNQPLIVDFKFVVEAPERLHLLLGKSSGRLGQNAWLLQRDNEQDFVQAQLRLLV